jgi:integrase
MRPGEWGKITVKEIEPDKFVASCYARGRDGRRRQPERSGRSEEDARRNLLRYLQKLGTPPKASGAAITERTSLAQLFDVWIERREQSGRVTEQSIDQYTRVWKARGRKQIGALRIKEFPTSRADEFLGELAAEVPGQAATMHTVLSGMLSLAARYDVITENPIREVDLQRPKKKPVQVITQDEFRRLRAAVVAYHASRAHLGGPAPGRLLVPFLDVLVSTGTRPSELLAVYRHEVDLLADPPVITISGTLIDHGRIKGKPLHRQPHRKHGAPAVTLTLPRLAVDALAVLLADSADVEELTEPERPLFANRNGDWMSLANLRRAMRAALPADLRGMTPKIFRPTVATAVRDDLGPAVAQQQLTHASLSTTEQNYLQRPTVGPDVRATLDRFAQGAGMYGDVCKGESKESG